MNGYLKYFLISIFAFISILNFIISVFLSYKYSRDLKITKKSIVKGTVYLFFSGLSGFIAFAIYIPSSLPSIFATFVMFFCLLILYYGGGMVTIKILNKLEKRREK